MPITKSDLINETAISCGLARDYAKIAIEQFFEVVKDIIKSGNSLELRGFGTFSPKACNPRFGRNIKSGKLIPLAASKSMSFKYSPELKAKVTGSSSPSKKKATAKAQAQARELAKTNSP